MAHPDVVQPTYCGGQGFRNGVAEGKMEFNPTETPMGDPVLLTFEVMDRAYVVDIYGNLFYLYTSDPLPENWLWTPGVQL